MSYHEFVISTYYHGNFTCKFQQEGVHILIYATPVQEVRASPEAPFQYNITDEVKEEEFASVDIYEPLARSRQEGKSAGSGSFPSGTTCKHGERRGEKILP